MSENSKLVGDFLFSFIKGAFIETVGIYALFVVVSCFPLSFFSFLSFHASLWQLKEPAAVVHFDFQDSH